MEIKSEYYNNLDENMEKYGIAEEDIPMAEDTFQALEEQMFSFAMFMLMRNENKPAPIVGRAYFLW